jgi:hypothetical protein
MKSIFRFFAVALLFAFGNAVGSDPNPLDWAEQLGGAGSWDYESAVAVDTAGNAYVTGDFSSATATFGDTTITKIGGRDLFVAKYGPSGSLVWVRRDGGAESSFASCFGRGIAVDGDGNVLVTGYYNRPVTFGADEANEIVLDRIGPDTNNAFNIFVAKYQGTDGSLLWAKRAGGRNHDAAFDIAVGANGNSCLTGNVGGNPAHYTPDPGPLDVTFGEDLTTPTVLQAYSHDNVFVAQYSPAGALTWAKIVDAETIITTDDGDRVFGGFDNGHRIAVDGNGDCVITGQYNYGATFGPGEANQTTLYASGFDSSGLYEDDYEEVFVAKFAGHDGSLQWAKSTHGNGLNQGWGVATDSAGNVVVTGLSFLEVTFGAGESNAVTLPGTSGDDVFVAKYGPDGALLWARRDGGDRWDQGYDVAADGAGNIYATGYIGSGDPDSPTPAVFGASEEGETVLAGAGNWDVFVAKYHADGTLDWAKSDGGPGSDTGYSLVVDGSGNSLVAGSFRGTETDPATFGAGESSETQLEGLGGFGPDFFLMKLGPSDDQPPIVSGVIASPNPVAINTALVLTANVDDSTTGGSDIAAAEYAIASGASVAMSAQDGTFDEVTEDIFASLAAFTEPGVYDFCVAGTDAAGHVSTEECTFLPVYDPEAGFVTGGGWVDSPAGAYRPDPILEGKANFGFVSKYKKGKTEPDGNTQFQFHAGDLNFYSDSYHWLVVGGGGSSAHFKGVGTINGAMDPDDNPYGFMIWSMDGEPDTFRIRIWSELDGVETDIYDNGFDQPISGGSVVIHTKNMMK